MRGGPALASAGLAWERRIMLCRLSLFAHFQRSLFRRAAARAVCPLSTTTTAMMAPSTREAGDVKLFFAISLLAQEMWRRRRPVASARVSLGACG